MVAVSAFVPVAFLVCVALVRKILSRMAGGIYCIIFHLTVFLLLVLVVVPRSSHA